MVNWENRLYNRGFLLTERGVLPASDAGAALQLWQQERLGRWNLWVHPLQRYHTHADATRTFLLVGHAYNPFTMEENEEDILAHLSGLYSEEEQYRDYFDQLTGVFFYAVIEEKKITAICDCAGMYGAYYGKIQEQWYFSSHCQLIADLCALQEDPYVADLKKSRFFKLYGWYLPADLSPYKEIKRIVPNTEAICGCEAEINRFYPRKEYTCVSQENYAQRVAEVGRILQKGMELVVKKWTRPAMSLTGGTDSKTSLACAHSVQDKLEYFSYISLPREANDAHAAHNICNALGLMHTIFDISTNPQDYAQFEEVNRLVERHYGYLGKGNSNDICKRIYLAEELPYDVEIKSWVSEVARASRYGKYHKKRLPNKMTPRRLTSMYKIFLFNRSVVRRTDRAYKHHMQNTKLKETVEKFAYPWSEFFVWENVFGGWGGLALTGEHMISNEITVPYNNRALLDLMLRTPLSKRMTDTLHRDIMDCMDSRINALGIHVVNGNETKFRAICEGLYFDIHSHLPI